MGIPFNHSKVTDTVIRALRYSSLISSDASAEAIRTVDASLTDAELDALVATLDYGSGSGGSGGTTSLDDLYLRVDSDAQPIPPKNHTNFLRVTRWTETGAVENPEHEMASVYWPTGVTDTVDMVIGPDTNILNLHGVNNTYWTSRLYLGAKRGGSGGGDGYFYIAGGPNVGTGGEEGSRQHTNGAFADYSSGNWHRFFYNTSTIHNGADARAPFIGVNYMFGGFARSANSDRVLFVGEFGGITGTEALVLEDAAGGDFRIKLNSDNAETLMIRGSDAKWGSRVHINGSKSVVARRPGAVANASLAVFGPDTGFADIPLISATDIRTSYFDSLNMHIVQIRADADRNAGTYSLLTAWAYDGITGYEKVIRVSSTGTVYSEVVCADGGADLAEWVDSDSVHPAGTVMVIDAAGKFVASTGVALTTVAGVITNTPALTMNYKEYDNTNMVILTKDVSETGDVANLLLNGEHTLSGWITIDGNGYEVESAVYNAETEKTTVSLAGVDADHKINIRPNIATKGNLVKLTNRVLMGMCGQISTSCSTANGDITPGDLLVSGANGKAQKSDLPAAPGTVLGKALGTLVQPDADPVEGTITVLVTLQ